MQFLRNLTWWLTGLSTLIVFTLVVLLSEVLAGQFWDVPRSAIICVYVGIALGFMNRTRFLRLGETLVHEIGHAQMAALTFGRVAFIRVERDTSGVTYHNRKRGFGRLTIAIVSLFGPISSSVVFVITARLVASELTAYWAIGLGIFVALILITTVRNFWGWATGLVLLSLLYFVLEASGYIAPQLLGTTNLVTTNNLLVNAILAVTAFNVGSALHYSFQFRVPRSPNSDEYKFSKALFLPGSIGGTLIILIQLALVWIGLSYLLGWPGILEIGRVI
ncbi:MAG: M50 family metallopeptidase [Actinobacteria bacterium]|nr:M50 family metallopeptidase [Actinomycetota bacterium]